MSEKSKSSIVIIKRNNASHGGHHGGAWKVAYADFVTAMMAFFLLLWLLSTANHAQLEGISEYFTPNTGIPNAKNSSSTSNPKVEDQDVANKNEKKEERGAEKGDKQESEYFQSIADTLRNMLKQAEYGDNVVIENVADGLSIQILDREGPKRFLFFDDDFQLQPPGMELIRTLSIEIQSIPRYIAIISHNLEREVKFDPWELSSKRANSAMKYMLKSGLDKEKVARLISKASAEPLFPKTPNAIQNRRIGIVLLKNSVLPYSIQNMPEFYNSSKQ